MGAVLVAAAAGGSSAAVAAGMAVDVAATAAAVAYVLTQASENSLAPPHAPDTEDERFPLPEYLRASDYACTVNIGIFGPSGVGKSTLINSLRALRPGDTGAAPVGSRETTMWPTKYHYGALSAARLWDIPGAGTERFPRDSYIRDMGLRFFDVAVLVTATRVTEVDLVILSGLRLFEVPCFLVRSKIDIDIRNEEEDNRQAAEVTKRAVLEELLGRLEGIDDAYLVSKQADEHDLPRLRRNLLTSVCLNRRLKKVEECDCPACEEPFTIFAGGRHSLLTCSECSRRLCRSCAEELRNPLSGVVPCPFCGGRFRGPERLPGPSVVANGIVEHVRSLAAGVVSVALAAPSTQFCDSVGAASGSFGAGVGYAEQAAGSQAPAFRGGSLPAGTLVEAVGLVTAAELNGKQGSTNGQLQGGRLGVDFSPPHGTKALRLENLRVVCEDLPV